ncbi:Rpn family recombination-promoting nuclease/putative transposase [Bacillus thuringiensis]|uniref:Rpn family recombination-promoting nuclease/putative transposase n=1 Tax=Bacillus thuringiensis TaxID=1428 RepID=UPI000B44C774|nr:Rpn family recombination-promoting nuclease/putative transposase [Bacillus thuringiensis]MED3182553.1 Rpn family recombination-promoting nuclease/putative transposase [Bacillus thuringiensis]OTY09885.1 ATPase [Bacillus thuringiensis serovar kim]OUB13713.1 ATPase [Bacillus thuringiensis serovar xiaguangiensis]
MSTKLVNLRIDFAFKQLFGTKGNEEILTGFLNAILGESLDVPIVSLQLEDPHLHKSYEDDKLSILDLLATLDNGTQVNIEIQLRNTHDMVKRSLYYWSKLYTSQMQEGMPYRSLRKTITINLLDFILFSQDDSFHTIGKLWNHKKQQILSDDIEIHFVEIPKLVKQWREEKVNPWENAFVRWMLLLPAHEDEHLTQTLEEIAMNQDPILQKAMNKWENMSHDSSFRTAYEAREKLLLDEQAKLAHAREEGLEEGIEKGKIQLIRGMHKNGMLLEDIAKFTGLSTEEIRKLLL